MPWNWPHGEISGVLFEVPAKNKEGGPRVVLCEQAQDVGRQRRGTIVQRKCHDAFICFNTPQNLGICPREQVKDKVRLPVEDKDWEGQEEAQASSNAE